ncbi:chemotaxis response regulator protein-glutamate methylesterase [Cohnella endophytica]|uniref:protein-glutamate methylesterase n=2 Tax=Cohnella endophytica TaxID=2419778 RepID=A0A494Y5Q1_9BACL|nr:chemotaxis response regulator protein-glutamate methylesterase [Cohnella endophytica]
MNKKPFRFLPAVEEKAEPTQPPTRTSEPDASTATSLPDPENIPDQLPLVGNEGSAGKEKLKPIANDSLPRKPAKPDSPAKSMASGASSFQTDNRIKKTSTEGLSGEIDRPKTKPAERKIAGDKLPESRTAGLASGLKRPEPKGVPPAEVKRPLKNPVDAGKPEAAPTSPPATTQRPKTSTAFTHIVAIGTSTGGPRALHEVLTGIPGDFPAPILVVQHMPPKFTNSLAQRLDQFCSIHVREASDGETIETGTAYIAPGGRHMSLAKELSGKYRIRLSDEGPRSGHMPSVDVMFESLIGHSQLKRHVVLMTGMGSDGAKGMKALQTDGALTTIAEAEQTCVVYGMPRSAVELGAVSHQLPLQEIASVLVQEVKFRK